MAFICLFCEIFLILVYSCICLNIAHAGNCITCVPKFRTRMIMSEKQNDGTVAMLHGDAEGDFHAVEDYLPTLPNTVSFTRRITAFLGISLLMTKVGLCPVIWDNQ